MACFFLVYKYMVNGTKEIAVLDRLANELKEIKLQLRKFILLIPEESLRKYKNSEEVKNSYREALKSFPPQ